MLITKLLTYSTLFIILTFGRLSAQPADPEEVTFEGTIVDALTSRPVVASITYESLPYGSKIGIFTDSIFRIRMMPGKNYTLTIKADNYMPVKKIIRSDEISDHYAYETIELRPIGIDQLIRLDKLIFGLGKAHISEDSYKELDDLADLLQENQALMIRLEGHTDFRGDSRQNMRLSEERVEAVRSYLVSKGVDKSRIKTKAFGGTQPLSRATDEVSRSGNRRVEVRILAN